MNLTYLDLSNIKFTGRIPFHLERLRGFALNISSLGEKNSTPKVTIIIKTKDINLSFEEPYEINTLFDLSNNNLTGEIPTSIGSMSTLRWLNLSGNQLEGPIPTSLSNISSLEVLDLARNYLTGKIPEGLSKLSFSHSQCFI